MPRIRLKNKNFIKKIRVAAPPFRHKKAFLTGLVLLYAVWIYGLRRPVWRALFGKPDEPPPAQMAETWEDFAGQDWRKATVNGYDILYRVRKKYSVSGRVVYIDWYRNIIGTWYRSASGIGTYLYDGVVPVDVSVIHGATAAEDNRKKLKFSHEERLLLWKYLYKDNPVVNRDEINNNHVIPASENIVRALKTVKTGEPVYLEGYLIDWKGTGKYADYEFYTALTPGEISDLKAGGSVTGLCRQIYLTKVSVAGRVFE